MKNFLNCTKIKIYTEEIRLNPFFFDNDISDRGRE